MVVTPSSPSLPGTETGYSILDLISLETLQQIQDAFARANNIASTLADLEGVAITVSSNHCRVANCVYCRQS